MNRNVTPVVCFFLLTHACGAIAQEPRQVRLPISDTQLLLTARRQFSSRKYTEADRTLTSLIENGTREPLAHYLRGVVRYMRGDSTYAASDLPSEKGR